MVCLGEALSVGAALFWAVGVILFKKSGESMSPLGLNFFKNTFASILLIPTIPLLGGIYFPDQSLSDWMLLAVSGVLGIAIADTLIFYSLEKIGAALMAVVETCYAPIMITLSWIALSEDIGVGVLGGAGLIMLALFVGSATKPQAGKERKDIVVGILAGVLGIFLMGIGIVMIKDVLNRSPLIWATSVRLVFGGLALVPMILVRPNRWALLRELKPSATWKVAVPASFVGTYLAMLAWIGGMKYTDVSVASLLNQLSTIFIFILATVFLKEPLTWRRSLAIVLAFCGGILVVLRQ